MGAQSNRQEQISKAPHRFLKEPFLFLHVQDQKAANTAGGTFTQDAWQKRDLDATPVVNQITGASVASSVITLPPGTYNVEASAPACAVGSHRLRLRDTTGSATLALGKSREAPDADKNDEATLRGQFTLTVESDVELQHYCETTNADDGFGLASNLDSQVEVYAEVWLQKLS